MSTAKHVKEIGPRMDWVTIEDSDGRVWKYRRSRPVDLAEPAQLEGHYAQGRPIRAVLVRDDDGHAMLHDNGTGMPRSIVVDHIDDPHSPLLGLMGISPKEEYVLVA